MGKISEIVKINTELGSEVNLIEELFNVEKNSKRMANYMPTKGHRDAFEKIVKGLYEIQDKRAYILNGSYGTGKSNLLLMIANYLMNNSASETMSSFFNNYTLREEDEKIGEYDTEEEIESKKIEIEKNVNILKSLRKTDKPHFVALCKYEVTGDFTEIVLRAINEAFKRENLPIDKFDSIYNEAVRRIELWEEKGKNFYDELERRLEEEKFWSVDDLKNKLNYIDLEALEVFKKIHKEITLMDFTYLKDNLSDIIEEIVSSDFFKEKYSGLTIFFDEFGDVLKKHNFNELVFQRFSEFCQNSLNEKNVPVLFIATTHRSFNSYGEYYAKEEFKKVSDRFNDVSLSTEGFENIISTIVQPDKKSDFWIKNIKKSKIISNFYGKIRALRLFENLKGKKLTEKLIENLYPMHPMATYALLELSKEVSSNNRSVYSFFVRGEFEKFIKETDLQENLKFYTVEKLIEYFGRNKFVSSNTELRNEYKNKIRNYETSKSAFEKIKSTILNEDELDLSVRILDIMLVYDLLDKPTDIETILFGLNLDLEQIKELEAIMKLLTEKGVIYFKESGSVYEFKQSDILNIDGIISEYVNTNLSKPIDIVNKLKEIAKDRDFIGIKKEIENFIEIISSKPEFYVENNYQKDIITAKELESEAFVLSKNKKISSEDIFDYTVDGYYYYILCETTSEKERALKAVKNIKESNFVFAVPKEVKELKKHLLGLLATKESEKLRDLKQQEMQMVNIYQKKKIQEIVTALKENFKIDNLSLFFQGEEYKAEGRNKDKELITEIFRKNHYKNLPSIDLSFKQRKGELNSEKEKNFKKFIESFLFINNPLQFEKNTTISQEYLKPFIDSEILLDNEDYYKQNSNLECYRAYPALKDTLEFLSNEELILGEFKKNLVQKYALGKYAAYFIIAFIYRYFNGNLSFIRRGVNFSVTSYEELKRFIESGETIKCIKISENEKEFLGNLFKVFNETTTLTEKGNVKETFSVIKEWYSSLRKYQKIDSIVEKNIINIFEKINNLSAEEFLLSELNTLIGREKDDLLSVEEFNEIVLKIKTFKESANNADNTLYSKISEKLNKLFDVENLYTFFNEYYNNLPDFKKDLGFKIYQNSDPRNFLEFLRDLSNGKNLEELLLNYKISVARDYKDWEKDNTEEIVRSIQKGYNEIDSAYLIPKPELEYDGEYERKGTYIYFGENFRFRVKNLNKEYDTYYTLERTPLKVINSFGESTLKVATDEFIVVEEGSFFNCLNQQDGIGKTKKRSEELEIKFIKKENKFAPEIQEEKKEQMRIGEKSKEASPKVVFNIIPEKKEDLKASIRGLIETLKREINLSNKDIKDILEQLVSEYSKGE